MKRRASLLGALAVASALAGCGRGEPAPKVAAPSAPAASSALALPPAGQTRVERRGDRYDVTASEATPLDALTELSKRAGFRVERGSGSVPEARRTLWLRDVSLERAVATVLAGVPNEVHHEFEDGDLDPARPFEGRVVALTRVTVGAVGPAAAAASPGGHGAGARAPRRAGPGKEERAPGRAAPERAGRAAPADSREREEAQEIERDARDSDPDVRVEAIARMDADGPDRARLEQMLRDDASADVRAAAAESLGEGNPFEVTPGLLGALADPDPGVVEASVRALEDVYDEAPDPRIRERISALRDHRDAGVREAVEEFESWIEE